MIASIWERPGRSLVHRGLQTCEDGLTSLPEELVPVRLFWFSLQSGFQPQVLVFPRSECHLLAIAGIAEQPIRNRVYCFSGLGQPMELKSSLRF